MNRCNSVGALLTVLLLAACSGEGSESAAPDTTKSSKELKDLTADDVRSECGALASRIALSKEDTCEFAGLISAASGQQSCDTIKEKCLKDAEQHPQSQAAESNCLPPTEQRVGCSATVAEFELCAIAQADVIRTLTCTSTLSTLDTLPQDCEALGRKCPSLLGISDNSGQGGSPTP